MSAPRRIWAGLGLADHRDWPPMGLVVPGVVPRALLLALGVGLTFVAYGPVFLVAVGLGLALVAAVAPRTMAAWLLILILAASRLRHDGTNLNWQLLVLLAGLHLTHVLSTQTLDAPARGWVQVATGRAPLVRFAAIQVPAQLVAVVVLLLR